MGLLKTRAETDADRKDLVRTVAALTDEEWQALVDEARSESLVPLAHLVIEGLAPDITALAGVLGDTVILDDIGRRAVTRDTARQLFTQHAEHLAAAARRKAQRAATFNAAMAEQSRRNRAELRGGVPAISGDALADLRHPNQ